MRGALLAIVAALACTGAAPATFTIDDASPALAEDRTVSLDLTNLTADDLRLTVTSDGCRPTANPETLPAAQHTTVTVTLPEDCDTFTLAADGTSVDVTPEPAETDPDQWWFLLVFLVLPINFTAIALAWGFVLARQGKTELFMESTWTFKESWAGNVTVLGGLLTGIVGSSTVVKALLGADAEGAIGLATVGSAIAVAFIATGPVILSATKPGEPNRYSVLGMLLAAAITVSGGIGQLFIGAVTAFRLDFGGVVWRGFVGIAALIGSALLISYAFRSMRAMLERNTTASAAVVDGGFTIMGHEVAVAPAGARRSASL